MKPSSSGIDIYAFEGRALFSWLIKFRTLSRISHVGLACEHNGEQYVLESLEGKGVRLVPFRVWVSWNGPITAYRVEGLTDEQRQTVIDTAMKRLGCEYASPRQFLRSFGMVTRAICRRLKVRSDLESQRFFCSELVAFCLRRAGVKFVGSPVDYSPADVIALPGVQKVLGGK